MAWRRDLAGDSTARGRAVCWLLFCSHQHIHTLRLCARRPQPTPPTDAITEA